MARAISIDLRQRVCAAITEGLSCHQAAARFKVSVSSAIRWQARLRDKGSFAPQPQGGDRRSARIEAHADFILTAYEVTSDITLAELKAKLAARGADVGIGTLWRFFDRRRITLKKRRRTRPNNSAPT
jgi:transposase